jgi:acyl-[acyl-carrier-protein]-phospholipid O-acyltransferase/long-chain-fatty-acid--[acyl-carrier-protein] ligase
MGALIMSLNGIRTFFYPSPLHYRIIPEVIYNISATIMFGTDTFFNGYAVHANPYDFRSLRYVIAGAEKLKAKTRQEWVDKFGIRIFEAYGVTEAAPAISSNTPMYSRAGTVGRLLPKIEYFIQPVEGIAIGGKLCIKGPNIMKGYITQDKPGFVEPTSVPKLGEGWYDTGDIVSIDKEGYITILGREKRFAKIAGEMVSLSAVEDLIFSIDHNYSYAAICIEDEKKGEQIILFTSNKDLNREMVLKVAKKKQVSELYIPKVIIFIKEMPAFATGKLNYRKLEELAKIEM